MKYFVLIFTFLLINVTPALASVNYISTDSRLLVKKKIKKNKRKRKPQKIESPRVGNVYMIIGVSLASAALTVALIVLLINPQLWFLFLFAGAFFISGISMIIAGALHKGRNKDWDIDYR